MLSINKKFIYLSTFLVISVSALALLLFWKDLQIYAHSKLQEEFGNQLLSPVHEEKIKAIAKEMGMSESIIIRKMNTKALQLFGYHNAFAAYALLSPQIPIPVSNQPFMFISESFFKDLTDQEQRFLIGHELIHIREGHCRYLLLIQLSMLVILVVLVGISAKKASAYYYFGKPLHYRFLFSILIFCAFWTSLALPNLLGLAYRRHIEWVADRESLALLNTHTGALELLDRWRKEFLLPVEAPYFGLLTDHPAYNERKEYITALSKNKDSHENFTSSQS